MLVARNDAPLCHSRNMTGCSVTQKSRLLILHQHPTCHNCWGSWKWKQTWNIQTIMSMTHRGCSHICSVSLKASKKLGWGSRMADFSQISGHQPSQKWLHHVGKCCTAWHWHEYQDSLCAERTCVSPLASPLLQPPPLFTVSCCFSCCFSMISRLIGGEVSRLMAELEWWISSVSSIGSTTLLPGSISAWVVCFQPSSSLVLKA